MLSMRVLLFQLFLPVILFAQTGPKFEIEGGEAINSGSHIRGKEVNLEIKFRNTGDDDLKVTGVQTTCGCSSALTSGDVIKPGDAGNIKFIYNGSGFGPVSKSVIVTTNEVLNSYHTITVTMNMVDPITLSPQSIVTSGKVGEELQQTATIRNDYDKDITISEVTSNSPVIKVTSDRMSIGKGEAASLSISIKIFEESSVNAAVIIKTSEGEFQIPVLVDVK